MIKEGPDAVIEAPAAASAEKSPPSTATAKKGYKMPRLRKGEQVVAFRPSGHTKLTSKTVNYNFNMARDEHIQMKTKVIIALVLLSFIPFGMFVRNAEGNFRKAEIKKIAEKRRLKLDREHGIDRDSQMEHFEELDKIYRISEKQEIAKYLEIGKTPSEYYAEQERRGVAKDKDATAGGGKSQSTTQILKETLMQKSEEGVEVSMI